MDRRTADRVYFRVFSMGDLLTLAFALVSVATTAGIQIANDAHRDEAIQTQSEDLKELRTALSSLNSTTVASNASRLSVLETRFVARDQEISVMRSDTSEFRQEVRNSLIRIENKIDKQR